MGIDIFFASRTNYSKSHMRVASHSLAIVSVRTKGSTVYTPSEPALSLVRDANGSPEPILHHIYYLSSSWDSPTLPRAPLSIDVIAPHFLQLLHFLASFASSFPHFKKWKPLFL
jgi:hypothetical protein